MPGSSSKHELGSNAPASLHRLFDPTPIALFTATAGATSNAEATWPGSLTNTLPTIGACTAITSSGSTVGGVFRPEPSWGSVVLDFAGVGNNDVTLTLEIGGFNASGTVTTLLAAPTMLTGTATVANANPFTGTTVSATTYRLMDGLTLNSRCKLGQVLASLGGEAAEANKLTRIELDVSEFKYYYVQVTNISTLTSAICAISPKQL